MVIPGDLIAEMIEHARREFPNEACGVIASDGARAIQIYPIRNADASPVHYTLDAKEQLAALEDLDERGWVLGAIYHSHTHTRAYPSATDVEMAQISLAFYPETRYIIVSLAIPDEPEVRAYRIGEDGTIEPEPLEA